jgi:hypothetical protein
MHASAHTLRYAHPRGVGVGVGVGLRHTLRYTPTNVPKYCNLACVFTHRRLYSQEHGRKNTCALCWCVFLLVLARVFAMLVRELLSRSPYVNT